MKSFSIIFDLFDYNFFFLITINFFFWINLDIEIGGRLSSSSAGTAVIRLRR